MENIKIINDSDFEEVRQLFVAKKLKTREEDFETLKEVSKGDSFVEDEKDFETIVEEPIEVNKEESKISDFEIEVEGFPYSNTKKEDDIDMDEISRIKDELANKYKDPVVKEEFKPIIKEDVKPVAKMSREDFEKDLDKDSYSAKIKAFKASVKDAYEVIVAKIAAKQAEIDEITNKYATETEIAGKLQDNQKSVQSTISGINGLNLDFLTDKRDEESKNVLSSLELLFNKNREVLNQIVQELKNNSNRKESLGKEEQRAREEIARFKEELNSFMEEKLPLIREANVTDDRVRKTDEEVAKLTGFKDDPVFGDDRKPVANVINLQDKEITSNRFDELRHDDVEEIGGRTM